MAAAELKSDIELTDDTPYLALARELWGDCCEDLGKIDCVNTTPHSISQPNEELPGLYFAFTCYG